MRTVLRALLAGSLLAAPGLLSCQTSGGVERELREPVPPGSARVLFLVAAREKEQVAESLAAAGFLLAARITEAPFLLRATPGVSQGFAACGSLRNVKFDLNQQGRTLVRLAAKGWTGSCKPSIYDTLSARLRAEFDQAVLPAAPAAAGSQEVP